MKATPFSKEHYYPMCLAGGRDAVLIDYGGSNFLSRSGHTHAEAHQGAFCAWYKSAHKPADTRAIHPVITAGIQVYVHGSTAEPTFFEQEFSEETASVSTILTFRYGLKLRVSSFLTYDECIWCERVEVLECDGENEFDIGFRVAEPSFSFNVGKFSDVVSADLKPCGSREIDVSYRNVDYSGRGRLIAERDFDSYVYSSEEVEDRFAEGKYGKIKKGDVYSRAMILLGDNERHTDFDSLYNRAFLGYDVLHREHTEFWSKYFMSSELDVGDEDINHIYRLSRYVIKSHQHPDSGAVALGMLPNHWAGAISCSWDAEFSHRAMLVSGNFRDSEHFVEQYYRQAPLGYDIMKKCGFPGVGFTGWNTLSGEYCGRRSIEDWLTSHKPMFSAYAIYAIYNEWKMNPRFDNQKYRKIAEDVLVFWLHRLVFEGDDGLYYLRSVKDGAEMGVVVEVDSFTQMLFAKAFSYVGEMYGIERYSDIGKKMLAALECNRMPDGRIAAFKNSDIPLDLLLHYYYVHSDGLVSCEIISEDIERKKTPFGIDNCLSVEEYRHWPWNDAWAVECYVLNKMPHKACERISHMTYGASSLGALPEKIRLDGFPIGYYYTSPHATFVIALAESFAVRVGEEIYLGYGFTNGTKSASCRGVMTECGISVDMKIEQGRLRFISFKNISQKAVRFKPCLNPLIECDMMPENITLGAGKTFEKTF